MKIEDAIKFEVILKNNKEITVSIEDLVNGISFSEENIFGDQMYKRNPVSTLITTCYDSFIKEIYVIFKSNNKRVKVYNILEDLESFYVFIFEKDSNKKELFFSLDDLFSGVRITIDTIFDHTYQDIVTISYLMDVLVQNNYKLSNIKVLLNDKEYLLL